MTETNYAHWADLSEGELRARLSQRGYTDPIVTHWLATRDDPDTIISIDAILGRD